jgi:beta-lactamase class A
MKIKQRYKFAILIATILFLVLLPHGSVLNQLSEVVSREKVVQKEEDEEKKLAELRASRQQKQEMLLQNIQTQLSVNEKFSIAVYDINNAEGFGTNQLEQFHAASVMKLLVATTAFTDIERGEYQLSATVKNNLQLMINQSNNNSWEYFNQLQGFDHQQEIADELKLTNVKVWGNFMSAQGVSELLLKLYKGEILTQEHRELFFSYMQNTETENRISPAIPSGANFYHKTGTYQGGIHDVAIVIHPKNPFILVIFTNDNKGTAWETRFKSFQDATTAVYNYFNEI